MCKFGWHQTEFLAKFVYMLKAGFANVLSDFADF